MISRITKCALMISLASLLIYPTQVKGFDDDDEISTRMVGVWKGEGKAFGLASHPELKWEPTLGGRFMRIAYKVETKSSKGVVQVFEGHGYYKSLGGGKYQATWFDSQGAVHPIAATFAGDLLTANWGTEQTTMGKTTYRLVDAVTMEVVDYTRTKEGTWKEFSRATLKKE